MAANRHGGPGSGVERSKTAHASRHQEHPPDVQQFVLASAGQVLGGRGYCCWMVV
jgi:hypothetical protein